MSEGCIGMQDSRIGKWKIENGIWQEVNGGQPAGQRSENGKSVYDTDGGAARVR
jgi:hypothetical protein